MSAIASIRSHLFSGLVIPAHPLALDAGRRLDERRQRALTRYYLAAGAGGIAVGVHTTQFGIHEGDGGLYRVVLELAREEIDAHESRYAASSVRRPNDTRDTGAVDTGAVNTRIVRVAGIIGDTRQALREAELAAALGYDCGLLSLAALHSASNDELIRHCEAVADRIPLFGFYLQPAVGGRVLDRDFWRRFCGIENVVAIKVAPFDRERTLDVFHALAETGRVDAIALYTGNDDTIVRDLLATVVIDGREYRFSGGLLGQWSVWTRRAVELLARVRECRVQASIPADLLRIADALTQANAAIFDAAHGYAGCIPGIHDVLRRHGLMDNILCLDPAETLSPDQLDAIDSIWRRFPELRDDAFIDAHRDEWLQ